MELILPKRTVALLDKVPQNERHPGLQLDKYSPTGDQSVQKKSLSDVCQARGDNALFEGCKQRWLETLRSRPGLVIFRCETAGPLTLHLSRASALENAGICLHPLYGFAYLPGSGLKGMARAYAEMAWFPTCYEPNEQAQPKDAVEEQKAVAAWRQIEAVFGWAPGSDSVGKGKLKPWKPQCVPERGKDDREQSGGIVFHDAWPETWPRLNVDIINNHHSQYYEMGKAPGDWEDPSMVSFLAVGPRTVFQFGLSLRRHGTSQAAEAALLDLAGRWLQGALCHLGVGAKTAAGYGYFTTLEGSPPATLRHSWKEPRKEETRCAFEVEVPLQLVTPAFLGGADRHAVSSLRLPSLKGLLRFWWRAWHGDLTIDALRKREAAVFGSTDEGCGLAMMPAPQQATLRILQRDVNMGGGGSPLGYMGYGPIAYASNAHANLTQFDALAPEQTLRFRLAHRVPGDLTDALKTLWLLAALGGIGSRSRRGWGSMTMQAGLFLGDLPHLAACTDTNAYREALRQGLEALSPLSARKAPSNLLWTALSTETRIVISSTSFSSAAEAHEDLGRRFIAFRARDRRGSPDAPPGPDYQATKALLANGQPLQHVPERSAFGMPYTQGYSSLKGKRATFTPVWWDEHGNRVLGRRASTLLCKIVRLANGRFLWQVAFLPARFLPEGAKVLAERTFPRPAEELPNSPYPPPGAFGVATAPSLPHDTLLNDFLDWLEDKAPLGNKQTPSPATPPVPLHPPKPTPGPTIKPLNQGQTRQGQLQRKGDRWIARFDGDNREAVIVNSTQLPGDIREGAVAEFYIMLANKREGIRVRFEKLR